MSYEKRRQLDPTQEPERSFLRVLEYMDDSICEALKTLPKPRVRKRGQIELYRFKKQDLAIVLFLKMVQLTSNLRAGKLLIDHGFLYEWAMIRRLIRETIEDVMFLSGGFLRRNWTTTHDRYLEAFYAEDVNKKGKLTSHRPRSIPRSEIRSFLQELSEKNESMHKDMDGNLQDFSRIMQGVDSGHIHGKASSIMRYYDPEMHKFLTNGSISGDIADGTETFWLSVYLAILAVALAGSGFLGQDYWRKSCDLTQRFGKSAGISPTVLQQ